MSKSSTSGLDDWIYFIHSARDDYHFIDTFIVKGLGLVEGKEVILDGMPPRDQREIVEIRALMWKDIPPVRGVPWT